MSLNKVRILTLRMLQILFVQNRKGMVAAEVEKKKERERERERMEKEEERERGISFLCVGRFTVALDAKTASILILSS